MAAKEKSNIKNYQLWDNYQNNGSEKAREEIILEYLDLVNYQAKRVSMLVPNFIDEEDLKSYGIIGLMEAVDRYDPNQGVQFSTYASHRIRGAIIDHLRNLDWLPHSIRRDVKEILKYKEQLKGENLETSDIEVLADKTGFSLDRIKELLRYLNASQWLSLDTEYEEAKLIDLIVTDIPDPTASINEDVKKEILMSALDKLKEKERLIISLYYYEELTQKEIAEVLELSPARISQLHKKTIQRLRGFLAGKKVELIREGD